MQSVVQQTWKNMEYIVIDGDSTDGSVELIEQYADELACWVSEPDNGIYHAMNKGILVSKGEYLLFLNSGDYLAGPTVLQEVAETLKPQVMIGAGDLYMEAPNAPWTFSSPEEITFERLVYGTIGHQASFIHRTLFDKYGLYDDTMKIAADWAFFLKTLVLHQEKYQRIPLRVAHFDMNGVSIDPEQRALIASERNDILSKYFSPLSLPFFEAYKTQQDAFGPRKNAIQKIDRVVVLRKITTGFLKIMSLAAGFFGSKNA